MIAAGMAQHGFPSPSPGMRHRIASNRSTIAEYGRTSTRFKGIPVQTFKLILLIAVGIFFIIFGINLLIRSYDLKDPFSFVITFFASNLMILISAVLSLGFVIKLRRHLHTSGKKK